MLKDDCVKKEVAGFFKAHGVAAEELRPDEVNKRPDLVLHDGERRYLLEIKRKFEAPDTVRALSETMARGDIATQVVDTGRTNTIAGSISEGVQQLEAEAQSGDICGIWLDAQGWEPDFQWDQFRASLYGAKYLLDQSPLKDSRECFYFTFSEFHRHRMILDFAVISAGDQAQFCLNNYSSRFEQIRSSAVARVFGTAVVDPLVWESENSIYVADCDYARRHPQDVLKYLATKYGRSHLLQLDMKGISTRMAYP